MGPAHPCRARRRARYFRTARSHRSRHAPATHGPRRDLRRSRLRSTSQPASSDMSASITPKLICSVKLLEPTEIVGSSSSCAATPAAPAIDASIVPGSAITVATCRNGRHELSVSTPGVMLHAGAQMKRAVSLERDTARSTWRRWPGMRQLSDSMMPCSSR